MKKIVWTLLLSFFMSVGQVFAQEVIDLPKVKELKGKKLLEKIVPKKDSKSGLWGYVNEDGKFYIKPGFSDACSFEGNLARISVSGKWGAINDKGLFQIYPQYESLDIFSSDSLARVQLDGKYGLINNNGVKVVPLTYESIDYAGYGYLVRKDGLYGTMDSQGNIILEPQFDEVRDLDKSKGLEHICKDGKWGLLKDGENVINLGWDQPCTLMRNGMDGLPDLYLVVMNGHKGVVAGNGKYVVPVVYDEIALSSSGEYYTTLRNGKYGAISLKMDDLVSPILDAKPFFDEHIFKVYDNGQFFCVNKSGGVLFEIWDQLNYDRAEYATTKYYPDWAKSYMAKQNSEARQTRLDKSSEIVSRQEKAFLQVGTTDKYGLMSGGSFYKSSGTQYVEKISMPLRVQYEAKDGNGFSIAMVNSWNDGDFLLVSDGSYVSIAKVLQRFGINDVASVYPVDFCLNQKNRITVRLGVLKSAFAYGTLNIASPSAQGQSQILIVLSDDDFSPLHCSEMDTPAGNRLIASRFSGYYSLYSNSIVADNSHPLKRFDRNGQFDWEYYPDYGETFYDIEETENCVYLCGVEKVANKEMPILVQLSNRGVKMSRKTLDFLPIKPDCLVAKDYVLYAGRGYDFWPVASPYALGDEIGIRPSSAWSEWGDGIIGGLGIKDDRGKWIQTPVTVEGVSASAFGWEFGTYSGESIIVQHQGKYGLINKEGEIVVDPKYDYIECTDNPELFKTTLSKWKGVVNSKGEIVLRNEYLDIQSICEDIIVARRKDGMYGCFNIRGEQIIPFEYDEIRSFVEGRARIRYKGRFGFIDKSGEIIVPPFYDEVENFVDNCSLVTVKGKKAFVSLNGDWIASPIYDDGDSFSYGLAALSQNGKYGYIDKTGNFVIPVQYSAAKSFNGKSGIAAVALDGAWGAIDNKGNTVVPNQYDGIKVCDDGYVVVEKDGKTGIYAKSGAILFPAVCDRLTYSSGDLFRNGVVSARVNGERVSIDQNGNVIYRYSSLDMQSE